MARQEQIVRPRADWVLDGIAEYMPQARRLVDISPHSRPLLDAIAEGSPRLTELIAAGVTADLDGTPSEHLSVRPTRITELPALSQTDVIVAVDVLDRSADLGKLVTALERLVIPGGVVFIPSPVASGFEVQTLWERSPTVSPHLAVVALPASEDGPPSTSARTS